MRAGLVIDGDTSGAQKAIEALNGSMDRGAAEAQEMAAALGVTDNAAAQMAAGVGTAGQAGNALGATIGRIGKDARDLAAAYGAVDGATAKLVSGQGAAETSARQLGGALTQDDAAAQAVAKAYGAADVAATQLAQAQAVAAKATDASKVALAAGKITQEQYNKELLDTKSALDVVAAEHRKAQAELQRTTALTAKSNEMTGAQRAGMQQLTMNISDMTTMYSMGAKPAQIFSSQIGQISQAIQLLSGGTSKFATFLAGPWGMAIMAGTMILGPLIGKIMETKDSLDDMGDAAQQAMAKVYASLNQASAVSTASTELVMKLGKASTDLANVNREIVNAEKNADALLRTFGGGEAAAAEQQRLGQLEARRAKAQKDYKEAQDGLAALDRVAQVRAIQDRNQKLLNEKPEKPKADPKPSQAHAQALQRDATATQTLTAGLYDLADAYLKSDAAAMKAEITARAEEQGIRKRADLNSYVAQQMAKAVAQRTADTAKQVGDMREEASIREMLNGQVEQGLITAEDAAAQLQVEMQLRPAIAAQLNAEGEARTKLTEIIAKWREEQERLKKAATAAQDDQQSGAQGRQTAQLQKEIELTQQLGERRIAALRGLSGGPLEDELDEINAAYAKGAIDIRAQAKAAEERRQGLVKTAQATLDQAEAEKQLIDLESKFEREARAAQFFAQQVDALAGALANIDGIGGDIFSVLLSDNPTAALLGMGGIGSLAGLAMPGGTDALLKVEDQMTRALEGVFGVKAEGLAERLAGAATGAAIGGWSGGAFFSGSKSGQTGAMAGGALGAAAFKDLAGEGLKAALGSFGGPLASIAGSLLGGVLGKALSSTKRGSATFGDDGLVSTRGNSQSRITGATKAGNTAMDAFDALLEELGATASGINFSAGIRKKNYVLDPTGAGRTKGAGVLNFGQDDQAFYEAMIREIFADASFEGISEGWQKVLKDPSFDPKTQIAKVLALQGNQDELAQRKDGQAYELAQLDKDTDKLRAYATEAGEGMAEVEELYALKRKDILDKYAEEALEQERALSADRVTILQLEGKEAEARKAAFDLEVEGLTGVALAQKQRIFDLTEEAMASAKAKEVADARRALEIEIMQLEGDAIGALNAMRADDKAAMDASLGPLIDRRNALQDEAEAAAKAAAQGERITSLEIRLAQARGDDGLAEQLERQEELRQAATEQERAYLKLIYAAEDASEKLDKVSVSLAGIQSNYARGGKPDGDGGSAARAAQQAEEAEKARQSALDDLRGRLKSAYEAERAEIEKTIASLRGLADGLLDFRDSLVTKLLTPEQDYIALQSEFSRAAALATAGDQDAAARLAELGEEFVAASMLASSSSGQHAGDIGMVMRSIDTAVGGMEGRIDYEERGLSLLGEQVNKHIETNQRLESVESLLRQLNEQTKGFRNDQLQVGLNNVRYSRDSYRLLDNWTQGGTASLNTAEVE